MNCRAATRISSRLSDPRARRWWPAFVADGLLAATSHPSSVGKLSICLTREYRTGSERLLLALIVALTLRLSGPAVKRRARVRSCRLGAGGGQAMAKAGFPKGVKRGGSV